MSVRWRDVLKIHPAADLFPLLDADELRALGEDIRKHGLHEPIVVVRQYHRREGGTVVLRKYDLVLIDGRNRLDAMESAGFTLVRDGKLDPMLGHKALGLRPLTGAYGSELDDDVDPYAFVISRNIHRRHLTAKQKRALLAKLLKIYPQKSDRQISEMAKTSKNTAATVRRELEGRGQIDRVEARTDTKGRKQPARKPSAKKATKVPRLRDDIGPVADDIVERALRLIEEMTAKELQRFIVIVREKYSGDEPLGRSMTDMQREAAR